jgi:hypothetical protein
VGILNGTRDDGLTVVYNAPYLRDSLAARIRPPVRWATVAPDSATVPVQGCADLDVLLDAALLEEGDYAAVLRITSNDPATPLTQVPVTFHVGPPIAMEFDLDPNTLKLGSNHMGKWVTGYLEPPPPLVPGDLDLGSILLNGVVPVDFSGPHDIGDHDKDGRPDLMFKAQRVALSLILPEGDHVPVTVTGRIGTREFEGCDTIKVKSGKIHQPHLQEVVTAGQPYTVLYDVSESTEILWVALLYSPDLGATWTIEQTHLPNTGAVEWTVPHQMTESAKVAVVEVEEEAGEVGDVVGVLAMSGVFTIQGVLDALSAAPAATKLLPVAPNPSAETVRLRFELARWAEVALEVLDVQGRRVRTVARGIREPGWHEAAWSGDDELGVRLGAGIYFVRLRAEGREWTQRVVRMN